MLKMAKVDLHFGPFSDWGQFGNEMEGYALNELEDSVALAAVMFKQADHHMGNIPGA